MKYNINIFIHIAQTPGKYSPKSCDTLGNSRTLSLSFFSQLSPLANYYYVIHISTKEAFDCFIFLSNFKNLRMFKALEMSYFNFVSFLGIETKS